MAYFPDERNRVLHQKLHLVWWCNKDKTSYYGMEEIVKTFGSRRYRHKIYHQHKCNRKSQTMLGIIPFRSKFVNPHIFSSLWASMKNEYNVIMENSTWLFGNGQNIKFWIDNWCWDPLINLFPNANITLDIRAKVSDFIFRDLNGIFPMTSLTLSLIWHNLCCKKPFHQKIIKIILIWKYTIVGTLTFKYAYISRLYKFRFCTGLN